jgi:hypothetical protein
VKVSLQHKVQLVLSCLVLGPLLVYTWYHTSQLLASYIDLPVLGYVAALGIEAAVVFLAIAIGWGRVQQRNVALFYATLIGVVLVSFLANSAMGYRTKYGSDISTASAQGLDLVQGLIGLAATGLISLIVFSAAEVIGGYMQTPQETRKKPATKRSKKEQVLEVSAGNPDWSATRIAREVGCSVSTATRALKDDKVHR